MNETQEVKPYKRKRKGGKRKCVEVQGYTRKKPRRTSNKIVKGGNDDI